MSPIRILGSVLSLLDGVFALYIHYSGGVPSATASVSTTWLAIVGGVLVVDSLVSFAGVRMSFAAGAALSAAVLALVALQWSSYAGADSQVAAVLSVICMVLDSIAFRPARGLSEKDSPLNLPVFG